jgi:hypothetical protein
MRKTIRSKRRTHARVLATPWSTSPNTGKTTNSTSNTTTAGVKRRGGEGLRFATPPTLEDRSCTRAKLFADTAAVFTNAGFARLGGPAVQAELGRAGDIASSISSIFPPIGCPSHATRLRIDAAVAIKLAQVAVFVVCLAVIVWALTTGHHVWPIN